LQRLNAGTYASQASLFDQRYTYDSVGNISSLLDVKNSNQKQCFGYDVLDRLISANAGNNDSTCSGAVGNGEYADESYSYSSSTGNLTSKTGMGSYTYDATHKHAVASTSAGWAYQYDANGNMTRRDPPGTDYYDFVYNAQNQLYQAKKNGTVVATFTYDGDGRRVKSVIGSATTVFVGGHYEVSGSAVTKYYFGGSQRLAMRTSGGLTYLFGDQLGSTSVTYRLNDGQTILQLYRPWGEVRYSSGSLPTQYQYTGQYTYAADFGLYFYNARWYDSQLGRFNQADTLVPNPGDPQAWDRYAAMNNNPVVFVDPSGH
jgi:RHS repeat-associated protein